MANSKISALTATTTVADDDMYAVATAAGATKKITGANLKAAVAPVAATYITQTASSGLSAEQALGALATGILKSTTTTGVVSIASAATDYTPALVTENIQTASYTLVLADAGLRVVMNVGSGNNLTVPTNASVAFPIGTCIEVFQLGAGQTTFVMTSLTSQSPSSKLKLTGQYSSATLCKRATDTWSIAGDLSA